MFKPTLWLSTPQKAADTLTDFKKLNFHKSLELGKNNFWGSSKRIDKAQHLFLVYKSRKNENIVSLIGQKRAVFLDGKKLVLNDSIDLNGYNESYGELLDVSFSNIKEGRFWMNPELKDSQVFELLLVDQKSPFDVNEIRTYLSIKYGIDLIDHKQYTYNGKKLWNGENKSFNNHIFGLAAMSRFNLQPFQSTHSKDRDLIVSLTKKQQRQMNEGAYVLLGSNSQPLTFETKTKLSSKQWLVQTNKERVLADISIPVSRLNAAEDSFNEYELIVGAKGGERVSYSAITRDTLVVFKNVAFSNSTGTIVRLKEHSSDIKFETENNCNELRLKVDGVSATDGFRLSIADDQGRNVLMEHVPTKAYTVPNNNSAYFDVTLEYNRKKISKRITTTSGTLKAADLQKYYTLDQDKLAIRLANPRNFTYEWFKNDVPLGSGNSIDITNEGNYTLNISNAGGCSLTQYFSVGKAFQNEQWRVFPSPASVSEDVQVIFELTEKASVNIALYQSDGKLVKSLNLGTIQNKSLNLGRFASSAGVYMVVAYINDIPQIKKIIIK